ESVHNKGYVAVLGECMSYRLDTFVQFTFPPMSMYTNDSRKRTFSLRNKEVGGSINPWMGLEINIFNGITIHLNGLGLPKIQRQVMIHIDATGFNDVFPKLNSVGCPFFRIVGQLMQGGF